MKTPYFAPEKTYLCSKVKLRDRKNLLTSINRWFWASPKWTIALYAAIAFFLFSFIGQEVAIIQLIIDTLEPLSIILAVLLFIKEIPSEKTIPIPSLVHYR